MQRLRRVTGLLRLSIGFLASLPRPTVVLDQFLN